MTNVQEAKPQEETKICAYCRKERPISEMHQSKLIFINSRHDARGRYKKFVDEKMNWYCKDASCADYDQMAHEG